MPTFTAGECWTYNAPPNYAASRLIIGGVFSFDDHEPVLCCCVTGAPSRQADGCFAPATIPFLPLTQSSFEKTVVRRDGLGTLPEEFAPSLATWRGDHRGLTCFTVPFEGYLERMIAMQMAQIIGSDMNAA